MNIRDLIVSAILAVLGLFFVQRASVYGIGSFSQMGAGFFPLALGLTVLLIAALIAYPAFQSAGEPLESPNWRALIGIGVGISIFALCVQRFGIFPAVFLAAGVVAATDRASKSLEILALAIAMAVLIWLIFVQLLGLPLTAFRLP